jgi:AraC family transcriptional regulator
MVVSESARVTAALDCGETPDFRIRVIEYPKGLWQPIHTHEHASVTLVLRGAIEEVRNRKAQFALPFSLIVKKPGVPHSDRFGPQGCKTLQINLLPGFDLSECDIDTSRVIWHNDGGASIGPLLRLMKCIHQASELSASDVAFSLYEALEALPNKARIVGTAPPWLTGVKDLIDGSDPMYPLSMARLQNQAEIHPVHLTRQFKRHFGCTLRDYMQYRRVRAAVSFVAESSLTLTEIAHRCAFADQAHFCRAFRAIAKLTARDYRRLTMLVGAPKVENVQVSTPPNPSSLL